MLAIAGLCAVSVIGLGIAWRWVTTDPGVARRARRAAEAEAVRREP